MRKPKKLTKYQEAITHMPPLSNWPDISKPYDVKNSDVVQWIVNQPPVLDYLFQNARDRNLIVFNPETQLWQGREYRP